METQDNGKLLREMRAQLADAAGVLLLLRRAGGQDPRRRHPRRRPRGPQLHAARAARASSARSRRGTPRSCSPRANWLRRCAAGNTDRHQAVGAHLRLAARLAELVERGGLPAGGGERRDRVRRGSRQRPGRATPAWRRSPSPAAPRPGRGSPAPPASASSAHAGARRQVAEHRLRGRRRRERRHGCGRRHLRRRPVRPASRAAGCSCTAISLRRDRSSGSPSGPARIRIGDPLDDEHRARARWPSRTSWTRSPAYVDHRPQRGRQRAGRRSARRRRGHGGYFYEPTVLRRRRQQHAGRPRGDLRPGGRDHAVRHRGRGGAARQRHRVRPRGRACGPRTCPARTAWPPRLDAGTIWVNTYRAMSPMSPRQGFKNSGMGVEHGTEAIQEYTRLKSVWINTSEEPVADPFIMRS